MPWSEMIPALLKGAWMFITQFEATLIWLDALFGDIPDMINNGKTNVMPAQEGKLTDAQIHVVTAYVWGLSNKAVLAKP